MDRASFESALRRDGFECREGSIAPNEVRPAHAHDWDARLFILEGEITLVIDGERHAYRPGDSCDVPAGTRHEEHIGTAGVRYLAGRRPAA
ncbi:MAG: cupin domain-containing protein [Alphaproteobacteria bacterium]|nr:cupin domain-containing protein [Alphaproteobacteria bacterium]